MTMQDLGMLTQSPTKCFWKLPLILLLNGEHFYTESYKETNISCNLIT